MAATQLSRTELNNEFKDGERPSGADFANAWMSFLNKTDDGLSMDANANLVLSQGITLKDATGGVAGTLRFNGGQVQYHDGLTFVSLSTGAGGAFIKLGTSENFAFNTTSGGNIGIGTFTSVSPPTHRLEVTLADNSAANERVRFGNLVIHSGPTAAAGAYMSHSTLGGSNTRYALFQDSQGYTTINASSNTELNLSQNAVSRFKILTTGAIELNPPVAANTVTILGNTFIGTSGILGVPKDLTVTGAAFKPLGGPFAALASDRRVKKEIRLFKDGLEKLMALEPVSFKFNGKAGTMDDGHEYIGMVAQDLQKVLPELIITRRLKMNEDDSVETDVFTFDPGPITFIIINSIKEITERLNKLEISKTNEKRKPKNPN